MVAQPPKPQSAKTALNKLSLKPELGLFVLEHEEASAHRAMRVVREAVGNLAPQQTCEYHRDLIDISRSYWRDKQYDEAVTVTEIKSNLGPAVRQASACADALDALSPASLAAVAQEMPYRRRLGRKEIDALAAELRAFAAAAAEMLGADGEAKGTEAIRNCCAGLVRLREKITKADFRWTLAPVESESGNATVAFKQPDAQFVLAAAGAIDSAIKFPAVRSRLEMLRKERFKQKDAS